MYEIIHQNEKGLKLQNVSISFPTDKQINLLLGSIPFKLTDSLCFCLFESLCPVNNLSVV